jgi:hypothetical protein
LLTLKNRLRRSVYEKYGHTDSENIFWRIPIVPARFSRFSLVTVTLILSLFSPLHPTPYPLLPAAAQTTDPRQAEADRLLDGCLNANDFQSALQACKNAAENYKTIQDRKGEALK